MPLVTSEMSRMLRAEAKCRHKERPKSQKVDLLGIQFSVVVKAVVGLFSVEEGGEKNPAMRDRIIHSTNIY